MKPIITETIKARDRAFINNFCSNGDFLDDSGNPALYVCRPINVDDVLKFMHEWDTVLLKNITP